MNNTYIRRNQLHRVAGALGLGLGLLVLLLLGGWWPDRVHAQDGDATPVNPTLAAINATLEAARTPTPVATVTLTSTVTPTATEEGTGAAESDAPQTPVTATVTVTVTATPSPTPTATPTSGPPTVDLLETEVLTGTIFANRTGVAVKFFLEGRLYELPPFRSTGVSLQRPLTALTLYNCEAGEPEDRADCFWDPYPVARDGFYEIINGAEADAPLSLLLEEAVPPPTDQIWLQNRTGHSERFLLEETLYELDNSNVLELALESGGEGDAEGRPQSTLYLRRCLGIADRSVCEWLPHEVQGGVYYALVDRTTAGATADSAVTRISIEPVLGQPEPTPTPTPTLTPTPEVGSVACQIQVPALNVRSGPGLEYLVIDQIRTSDESGGRVLVSGRTADDEWVAVDEDIVPGGWLINSERFLICEEPTDSLPVAEVTDGRLAPTPVPTVADEAADEETTDEDGEEADTDATPTPEAGDVPEGQARLIATNAFEAEVRFTLSAREHGLPEGTPSEYDLQPGQSVEFLIRPGRVQFSASTPFRGGHAGNAEFVLEEGATRELFLRFVPAEGDPNRWDLQYE